jgi:hypothetical protein
VIFKVALAVQPQGSGVALPALVVVKGVVVKGVALPALVVVKGVAVAVLPALVKGVAVAVLPAKVGSALGFVAGARN